ncbi:unnamed protein product [Effrenium voratum]|nr:unnamed protein product [Effrenium voratum]
MTGMFMFSEQAATAKDKQPSKKEEAKARFTEADLVVPGVALKKFQQCLTQNAARARTYLAVLGSEVVNMYKQEKPKLAAMCCGSYEDHPVLENMPSSINPGDDCPIHVFALPSTGPLGEDEHDFSNIKDCIKIWNQVLQSMTALGTHGSRKPADQTWKSFFEGIVQQDLPHGENKERRAEQKLQKMLSEEASKTEKLKRRRQLYFAKKTMNSSKAKRKGRPTKDAGKFDQPPPLPRRTTFLEDKIKVVRLYLQLQAERDEAAQVLSQPKPPGASREEKAELREKKLSAKTILRRNLQKECEIQFGSIIGKTQVVKWVKAAEREGWEQIPSAARAVPLALQQELDHLILEQVRGNSEVTERAEVVTPEHATTIAGLINDWNDSLEAAQQMVKDHNQQLLEKKNRGELTAAATAKGLLPTPKKVDIPSLSWCYQFTKIWGWSLLTPGASSQCSLPYGHADMEAARNHVANLVQGGCHPALILNYDQVWRVAFDSGGRLFFKERSSAGQRVPKQKVPKGVDKKHGYVKGTMTPATIRAFNSEHVGTAMVMTSGGSTHFMCADTLLQVMEQLYSPALQLQRAKYNLSLDDPAAQAALLCDAWTGSFATQRGEALRRPRLMPGGWSAHGQPVDQLHGTLRRQIRKLDLCSVGMTADLRARKAFQEMDLRSSGHVYMSVKGWSEVVDMTLEAWNSLERKVFQSAWLLCGLFDWPHMQRFAINENTPVITLDHAQALLHDEFAKYGLASTPQRCTTFEWQIQEGEEWRSLPYEVASAVVRTLVLHCHRLNTAKDAYGSLLENDPKHKNKQTQRAKQELDGLRHAERYIVLNPRTGQLATQSWLSKHIKTVDGKPELKKKGSTARPWVMTLMFALLAKDACLKLKIGPGENACNIRCVDLRSGSTNSKVSQLLLGYKHFSAKLDKTDQEEIAEEDDDWSCDGYQSDESQIGDAAGQQVIHEIRNLSDPAPAGKKKAHAPTLLDDDLDDDEPVHQESDDKPVDADDFIKMVSTPGTGGKKAYAPPSFFSRPAYQVAAEKGLVQLPPSNGYGLWHHTSTSQWHAHHKGTNENFAPSYKNNRSEEAALLLAMEKLWLWYLQEEPTDVDGAEYLARIQAELHSMSP